MICCKIKVNMRDKGKFEGYLLLNICNVYIFFQVVFKWSFVWKLLVCKLLYFCIGMVCFKGIILVLILYMECMFEVYRILLQNCIIVILLEYNGCSEIFYICWLCGRLFKQNVMKQKREDEFLYDFYNIVEDLLRKRKLEDYDLIILMINWWLCLLF